MPKIIKTINQIIGEKTIFQLSKNKKTSKVVFESYDSNKYAAEFKWSWKGYYLDKWGKMLDEYYELHKWNKKSGEIPKERLKELDILI